MRVPGPATRIFLAPGPTDLRRSFDGLHGLVRAQLQEDPRTLSEPLREVFQGIVGERDEARLEHRRVQVENQLLKERIRLLLRSK
jgi:hypothetical protein